MAGNKKQRKEKQALRNEGKLFLCMACKDGKQCNSSVGLMTQGDMVHRGKYVKCFRCEILFLSDTDDLETTIWKNTPVATALPVGKVFDVEALEERLKYCLEK